MAEFAMGRKRTRDDYIRRSGGGIDPELAGLAVKRGPPDPQPPCDFGHAPAIMADGEADDVGFDVLERTQMAVAAVERDSGRTADDLLASRLAHGRHEVRLARGVARLSGDVREVLGRERAVVALQGR